MTNTSKATRAQRRRVLTTAFLVSFSLVAGSSAVLQWIAFLIEGRLTVTLVNFIWVGTVAGLLWGAVKTAFEKPEKS